MDPQAVKQLIEAGLPGSWVEVTGDGRHFEAVVVNQAFEGENMLQQHRLVYAALGDSFDTEVVHALALKTYTPAQWEKLDG